MAKHGTVMLGIRGELWGAYIGLLAAAGFRYPRDGSQCMPRNVLSAVFLSLCVNAMALRDGRAVKEYQKPLIQAKALGIRHHRGILTTIRSSFSGNDTYTSTSSPCQFLAAVKHRPFV